MNCELRSKRLLIFVVAVLTCAAMGCAEHVPNHLKIFVQCDKPLCDKGTHTIATASEICHIDEAPEEVWIETGHQHDLTIVPLETRGAIRVDTTNPRIVSVKQEGSTAQATANEIGVASLQILHRSVSHKEPDLAMVTLKAVSPKVSVVGWIDSKNIDLKQLAPNAGIQIRETLSQKTTCVFALIQWFKGMGTRKLYAINKPEDALYAKAALVKVSGNERPPKILPPGFAETGDYKLFSEFQLSASPDGNFDISNLPHVAEIGETAEPCGLLPWELNQLLPILKLDGEVHDWNDKDFPHDNGLVHVNQGRINKYAQTLERNLTDLDAAEGELTP